VITVYEGEQGDAEWHRLHLGIPTASNFACLLDRLSRGERKGQHTDKRREYLLQKVGERLTEEPPESFGGGALARGKVMEAEARDVYTFMTGVPTHQVAFVTNDLGFGLIGCSPDSMLMATSENDGLLEIKTKKANLQLEVLLADKVPDEHVAQLQGSLLVTGLPWVDFVSYWPKLPLFLKRVYRDERMIAELKVELESFYDDMNKLVEKFK
jgi:hypothetical protein